MPASSNGSLLLSGSNTGEVRIWDIRKADKSLKVIQMHSQGMTAFDVHDHVPIFST